MAPAAEAATPLQEVVITARRTKENLQSVPLSVTAFTGASLARQNIVDTKDLTSKVPSLATGTASTSRDSTDYVIRGQGQAPGGSDPAVVTYFAEVPTSTSGPGLLFDLQDLQVLKGPQGTLFGKNTTGGAILLEPQRPTDIYGGYIDLTAGDYNLARAQAALNVPIVDDKVLLRVALDVNHRDGFTKDVNTGVEYDDRDYQAYRASLILRPIDGLEEYLIANYATSNTHGAGSVLVSVNPAGAAAALFPGLEAELAAQKARGPRYVAHSIADPYDKIRSGGFTSITTYQLTTDIVLKNVIGIRDQRERASNDADGSVFPLVDLVPGSTDFAGGFGDPSTRSYSEEFQIQGKSFERRLQWLLGVYAQYDQPVSNDQQDNIEEFGFGPFVDMVERRDRSRAIFGQFTYDLGDFIPHLKFTGGARYTADWRSQTSSDYLGTPAACTLGNANAQCLLHQTAGFTAPTGSMSLDYQLTPKILLYVAGRHGYKSGGFNVNALTPDQQIFMPEYVTDVEVGEKTDFRFWGMTGRANADVFRGDFSNYQENGLVFDAASGQEITITQNAGEGVVQGLEFEGALFPIRQLELSGFYAYTDSYFEKNVFEGVDIKNLPFTNTPRHKASITARYDFETPARYGDFALSGVLSYQSRVYFREPLEPVSGDPQHGQGGYSLLNIRGDWTHVFQTDVDASFFVTNVTNKTYKIFENDSYDSGGYTAALYGEPRMFGFELRYHFGG